jgi:hypothetical protein
VNFGFHGISFGAPAPGSKVRRYGIWRLYNAVSPSKQATDMT